MFFWHRVTHHQVHLHHPSTKGVNGVFLSTTKIHFRAKIFREKTSHSEAEEKNKENTKAHHQALSYKGVTTATKP